MYLSAEQIRFLDAAGRGDLETVRSLLAAGVDANTPDDRRLPRNRNALMHAAERGHLDVVALLLAAGAKVNGKDRGLGVALPGGNTALLLALKNKHVRVAQKLLDAGASPEVQSGGVSALGQAASLGEVALVESMLKRGLDPDLRTNPRADPPLANALFSKQTEVVRLLLSAGADPNLTGRGRSTPLELAIIGGLAEAVQLLLHHGADPEFISAKGLTPLMTAVRCGQKQMIKILLQRDAAVNARNGRGHTALDIAQEQLNREVDEDFRRSLEREDLDVAGYLKVHQEIVTLLRDAGAKTGKQLPPVSAVRSKATPAKLQRPGRIPDRKPVAGLGISDLLELVHYTEPEFSIVAVRAPLQKAAGAFAALGRIRHWTRDVPRRGAAGFHRVNASVIAVVKIRRNPWTVIFRSLFRLGKDDYPLAVEDAKQLSARLKTRAIAFMREKKAEALGYDLFENGRLAEHAQWIAEGSVCWFKSRFRRKPGKEERAEDFADKVFRQQGIYLPACYPQRRGKEAWLYVEKVSAKAIQRADILVLPARKKRKTGR